ncbi:phenylalanine--tRNA ligase subunit beta [Yanshouia hominis]|uniref:Phenylalanine--tRNA ligase beta subunit n=1 Tax=Yanshouia hominis TaxID=2763673 RepID=A0ABR7NM78_9FIRM|nr:phenylalanine--tRNA ligase subunit beta [Yanshouia hominis]MBC8577507.1 phenylalanine--tRNA ligase subunit beta [Yanshouia hominis]
MDLSMRWLADYTAIPEHITPREFAEAMTMSGSKVEGYTVEGSEIKNVVVGKILSIVPHPDSDHMVICKVDVGGPEILQIVTGAQNLKVGDLVPAAVHGAALPGGHKIKTSKLRGELSQGMLCSLSELGLTVHDFPNAIEEGIWVLDEPCEPGQDIREAMGLNDTVVEFEITPNRPDCLSVTGLAREASATFGSELKLPEPKLPQGKGNLNEMLSVEVKNSVLCPRYVARAVTNVKIMPSPRWMRERLRASGVRPINNIVDITNYVMLEYGQPMHAFDVNCVAGGKLVIRNAEPGETLETLDGVVRTLSPEMLVIADAEKPSAVAGVMGGESSGIHDETVTVVFESANFLGSSVRTTARKLGMRTEASSRFEKGLDPAICRAAADRACELVILLGAGEPVEGVIDVDSSSHTPTRVTLEADWINEFLGITVSREQMVKTLESLGFSMDGDEVIVPSWRGDVLHKADIAEEVARFYGYNKIPSTAIQGGVYGVITPEQKLERLAVSTLLAQGMSEICSYTFVSPKVFDKIRLPAQSPLRRTVNILNPLGEDTSVMRTTVFPSMMEVLARNYNNRNASASLFELAKEFIPKESADILPDELKTIALGLYGEDADYYHLKGIVEELLDVFGIHDYDVAAVCDHPTFHPGRCAGISKDGRSIALIGEAHPAVCANYEMGTRAYLGRIDLAALFELADVSDRVYHPLPRFPASTRDLALLCDDSLPMLTIEKAVSKAIGKILESISLFDCYKGSQIPEGKKSLAFAISMRASDRTLTDSEVNAAMDKALAAVKALGCELRM